MYSRPIQHRYEDPLDAIWIKAAADLGLRIVRSAEVFASYDGKGTLTISEANEFDADDCLAQMIFHEICHWLVAGRRGSQLEDWGLSNIDDRDLVYEYAAIRVQASLSQPFGLRPFMAITTDWRPYWDALPFDPLSEGDDPAIELAREGAHLARLEPFKGVLDRALAATATIGDLVRDVADEDSLWKQTTLRHRLGSLVSADAALCCGGCAWAFESGASVSCRQHLDGDGNAASVGADERACDRWEWKISIEDCGTCGACCREGFHVVDVAEEDPFREKHPELVQLRGEGEYCVPRPGGVCVALEGDGASGAPYRCRFYEDRPSNCREFEVAGEACLVARRRVGLSR